MLTNEQYSRTECLGISGIPAYVDDNDLESKVLEISEETDVPIDPTLVEDCHHLPSKGALKKVIIRLNRCKDIPRILLNKNKLKNLKPTSMHLPGEIKIFINESLCLHYTFFYKNTLYKNTEAQITQKLRTMTRLDARNQKNFNGEK